MTGRTPRIRGVEAVSEEISLGIEYSLGSIEARMKGDLQPDFIALDFETATSKVPSICAIGIAVVINGAVKHSASELINPQCEFSSINSRIHQITADQVKDAPTLGQVWPALGHICEGQSLIFHHAPFDASVLQKAARLHGLTTFYATKHCSYELAKRCWASKASYSLPALAQQFGIELEHHNPGSDARACAELTLAMCKHLERPKLSQVARELQFHPSPLFGPMVHDGSPGANHQRLAGKSICFTGTLSVNRNEAIEVASNAGATEKKNISRELDLLIVGPDMYQKYLDNRHGSKLRQAIELRKDGSGPELVLEEEFWKMICEGEP